MNSFYKEKRVLVTGGEGFLGSTLVEVLAKLGAHVYVADIQRNHQMRTSRYSLLRTDINDYDAVEMAVAVAQPDVVFHLAAVTQVSEAHLLPRQTYQTNVVGTVNVLEAIRNITSNTPIIVASTDKAVGDWEETITESTPYNAIHPYDASKAAMEIMVKSYVWHYGLNVGVTRSCNIFGPRDFNFKRIIPGLMRTAILHENMVFRTDGNQIREYIDAKTTAEATARFGQRLSLGEIMPGETIIFPGVRLTAHNVIERLRRIIPFSTSLLTFGENEDGESPTLTLKSVMALRLLGLDYTPDDFQSRLNDTLRWYMKYFKDVNP